MPLHASTSQEQNDRDILPSIDEIMSVRINVQEVVGDGLLASVEREFNRCTAEVLAYSRPDAFCHAGSSQDTFEHKRARDAWTEWFMFAKCVMPTLPGGKAKEGRNYHILASNLARWSAGERASLWKEVVRYTGASKESKKRGGAREEERQAERRREEVVGLARRGLPSRAMQHAVSEGLASDTPETFAKVKEGIHRSPCWPGCFKMFGGTSCERNRRR